MIKFLLLIAFLIFAVGGAPALLGTESENLNLDETLGGVVYENGSIDASGIMNRVSQEVQNTSVHDVSRFFEVWSQRLFRVLNLIFTLASNFG